MLTCSFCSGNKQSAFHVFSRGSSGGNEVSFCYSIFQVYGGEAERVILMAWRSPDGSARAAGIQVSGAGEAARH